MLRLICVAVLGASAVYALAQPPAPPKPFSPPSRPSQPYQPAVPVASTFNSYGGWGGGGYGGGTAAGSAMNGMASIISAQGNYNLATSAAAVNMTQAQRNHIENRQEWTNTYFEMRATQRAAVAAERGPPPTQEQIARIAASGAPRPLNSQQVDPVSGTVHWPTLLQDAMFAPQRSTVEELLGRQAQYGHLGLKDQNEAGTTIQGMSSQLRDQIRNVPPQQYAEANSFLRSLMFSMTRTQL